MTDDYLHPDHVIQQQLEMVIADHEEEKNSAKMSSKPKEKPLKLNHPLISADANSNSNSDDNPYDPQQLHKNWNIVKPTPGLLMQHEVWFVEPDPYDPLLRAAFINCKIIRISQINEVDGIFWAKLILNVKWIMSKLEYLHYLKSIKTPNTADEENENEMDKKTKKMTCFKPKIEFKNAIKADIVERSCKVIRGNGYSFKDNEIFFMFNMMLDCEVEISEPFEMEAFPFDYQDLPIIIASHEKLNLFPDYQSHEDFVTVEAICNKIGEWDLRGVMVECSKSSRVNSEIVIRMKYSRNFWNVVLNYCAIISCIAALSLSQFSMSVEYIGDRLGIIVTLILTIVAFNTLKPSFNTITVLDKYVFCCFIYAMLMMIESSLLTIIDDEIDTIIFYCSVGALIVLHLIFIAYSYAIRSRESKKIHYTTRDVIDYVIGSTNTEYHVSTKQPFNKRDTLCYKGEKVTPFDVYHNYVSISCGICHIILWECLSPDSYDVGEPSQPHLSFELYTNTPPIQQNIKKTNEGMFNCKNNCHAPLWLIDNGSGHIDRHGHDWAMACGQRYTVVEKCKNHNQHLK